MDANFSVLNLIIVKNNNNKEKGISGLTDLLSLIVWGPKKASRIQKLFNLSNEDDAHQYILRKSLNKKSEETLDQSAQNSMSYYFMCPATHTSAIALKKQCTKKNK